MNINHNNRRYNPTINNINTFLLNDANISVKKALSYLVSVRIKSLLLKSSKQIKTHVELNANNSNNSTTSEYLLSVPVLKRLLRIYINLINICIKGLYLFYPDVSEPNANRTLTRNLVKQAFTQITKLTEIDNLLKIPYNQRTNVWQMLNTNNRMKVDEHEYVSYALDMSIKVLNHLNTFYKSNKNYPPTHSHYLKQLYKVKQILNDATFSHALMNHSNRNSMNGHEMELHLTRIFNRLYKLAENHARKHNSTTSAYKVLQNNKQTFYGTLPRSNAYTRLHNAFGFPRKITMYNTD